MMKRLKYAPGVNTELSASANPMGWSTSSGIRFRFGMPEVVLGWTEAIATTITGTARAIYYYADLSGSTFYVIGSNQKLYILPVTNTPPFTFGALTDITPIGFLPGQVSSGGGVSLLIWSLDNFGGTLISCPSRQGIYTWVSGQPQALPIITAPGSNQGLIVVDQAQIIMAYGCGPIGMIGTVDPLLVRWCDASDYTSWTASTTNQAGSYRLPRGTRIVGGLQVPGMALLWTDQSVWMAQYIGFPLVFSFQVAGTMCGLIAQKALVTMGPSVYWMSDHGFFRISNGNVEQIPCPVWDVVFKNIDTNNADKCLAGTDYHYSEVWFFYPSLNGNTGESDSYVKLNVQEGVWDYGPATPGVANQLARTAWLDLNERLPPLTVDLTGLLQLQDTGFTANGAAQIATIQSGFMDIVEGGDLMSVDQLIPDFLWDGPNPSLTITMYFRKWPGDTPTAMGPFTITPTTEYISLRSAQIITIGGTTITAYPAVRAREVAIKLSVVSGWFRMGNLRLRAADTGKV